MITVKTFPNMFVPMIKPTLRNANFGPNIFVKIKEIIMSKINMIDINKVSLLINHIYFVNYCLMSVL